MPYLQHLELSSGVHTHHLITRSVLVVALEASPPWVSVSQSDRHTPSEAFKSIRSPLLTCLGRKIRSADSIWASTTY